MSDFKFELTNPLYFRTNPQLSLINDFITKHVSNDKRIQYDVDLRLCLCLVAARYLSHDTPTRITAGGSAFNWLRSSIEHAHTATPRPGYDVSGLRLDYQHDLDELVNNLVVGISLSRLPAN